MDPRLFLNFYNVVNVSPCIISLIEYHCNLASIVEADRSIWFQCERAKQNGAEPKENKYENERCNLRYQALFRY